MIQKLHIYAYVGEYSATRTLVAFTNSIGISEHFHFLREQEVDIGEVPDDFNPMLAQVRALDAKAAELREELNVKLADIHERKARLLSLTMDPA